MGLKKRRTLNYTDTGGNVVALIAVSKKLLFFSSVLHHNRTEDVKANNFPELLKTPI